MDIGSMEDLDTRVLRTTLGWQAAGLAVVLVTVARTWGSSPRPPGALMAINARGPGGRHWRARAVWREPVAPLRCSAGGCGALHRRPLPQSLVSGRTRLARSAALAL
jgi:XdhC and CoxI family